MEEQGMKVSKKPRLRVVPGGLLKLEREMCRASLEALTAAQRAEDRFMRAKVIDLKNWRAFVADRDQLYERIGGFLES
jgi:hypothetical protein